MIMCRNQRAFGFDGEDNVLLGQPDDCDYQRASHWRRRGSKLGTAVSLARLYRRCWGYGSSGPATCSHVNYWDAGILDRAEIGDWCCDL
jgi:hypothetical protein